MWKVPIKYYSEWEAQLRKEAAVEVDGQQVVPDAVTPRLFYGNYYAAGIDLPFYDAEVEEITIQPGQRVMLKTGIYLEMPDTAFGFLDSRSSTSKLLLDLLCRTIDSDFRGNIRTVVTNLGEEPVTVKRGEYLFQLIIFPRIKAILTPVNSVEELTPTERADKGFGSTGGNQAAEGGNN